MKKFLLLLMFTLIAFTSNAIDIPKLDSYVTDFVGILNQPENDNLISIISDYEKSTSVEIAVVIINSTNGYDIAVVAQSLFEQNKIGKKDIDNGVLFLIALDDRKFRIHTGYGVEGILTDAKCFQILENIKPFFKNKDYYNGITSAVNNIIYELGKNKEDLAYKQALIKKQEAETKQTIKSIMFYSFCFLICIVLMIIGYFIIKYFLNQYDQYQKFIIKIKSLLLSKPPMNDELMSESTKLLGKYSLLTNERSKLLYLPSDVKNIEKIYYEYFNDVQEYNGRCKSCETYQELIKTIYLCYEKMNSVNVPNNVDVIDEIIKLKDVELFMTKIPASFSFSDLNDLKMIQSHVLNNYNLILSTIDEYNTIVYDLNKIESAEYFKKVFKNKLKTITDSGYTFDGVIDLTDYDIIVDNLKKTVSDAGFIKKYKDFRNVLYSNIVSMIELSEMMIQKIYNLESEKNHFSGNIDFLLFRMRNIGVDEKLIKKFEINLNYNLDSVLDLDTALSKIRDIYSNGEKIIRDKQDLINTIRYVEEVKKRKKKQQEDDEADRLRVSSYTSYSSYSSDSSDSSSSFGGFGGGDSGCGGASGDW